MHCEHGELNINLVDSQMATSFLYSGFIWLRFLKFKSNTTGTGTMETISTLQQPVWSWTTRTRTSMWRTWATPPWSPSWSSHSSSLLATSSMVWRSSKTPSSRWTILNLAHFDTFLFAANLDLAGMPHVPGERGNGHPDLVLRGLRLHQHQRYRVGVHKELTGSHGPWGTLHHNFTHLPHRLHLGSMLFLFFVGHQLFWAFSLINDTLIIWNLCYGVNLCYGDSPCYCVSQCYVVNPFFGVSLRYGVNLSYGVILCYNVNLCLVFARNGCGRGHIFEESRKGARE